MLTRTNRRPGWLPMALILLSCAPLLAADPPGITVSENEETIQIRTPALEAAIRKRGYVTGVAAQSLLDRRTGFRDAGFGLDIVDWIMEPGSDEAYRDKLPAEMVYQFGNSYQARRPSGRSRGRKSAPRPGSSHRRSFGGRISSPSSSRFGTRPPRLARRPAAHGARRSSSPPASGTSSPRIGSTRSTTVRPCSCGSICRGTSSTRTLTRSARFF